MKNVFDFIKSEGRKSFKELEFGSVDAMILSQLTYLNYDEVFAGVDKGSQTIGFSASIDLEKNGRLFKNIRLPKECQRLYYMTVRSKRYKDICISDFVNDINVVAEKQFAAMVFNLPDGTDFVAFRGTDNTIIGWKEDFNMTFMNPIPAQAASAEYLNRVSEKSDNPIRVGGHSKGGNLAVYAAAKCSCLIKDRIIQIYSFDGPGFRPEFLTDSGFLEVEQRIKKFVPHSSVVGMLLYSNENYIVVKSSSIGIMQHDLFSWQIENGDFVLQDALKNKSLLLDKTITDWLCTLDDEKRRIFINTLYGFVKQTKAETVMQLNAEKRKNAVILLRAAKEIDAETRRFVLHAFGSLLALAPKEYKKSIKIFRKSKDNKYTKSIFKRINIL